MKALFGNTVEEYVNFFNREAYIFRNLFNGKYLYYIPLCEYTHIKQDEYDKISYYIIENGDDSFDIRSLAQTNINILNGSNKLFVIPISFEELPENFIVYPNKIKEVNNTEEKNKNKNIKEKKNKKEK